MKRVRVAEEDVQLRLLAEELLRGRLDRREAREVELEEDGLPTGLLLQRGDRCCCLLLTASGEVVFGVVLQHFL